MKTKKQSRLYMRNYLKDPINRLVHNEYSKQYAARKYGSSKQFRKAVAKRAAEWNKVYFKKNPLVASMYQSFIYQVRIDENPHHMPMYDQIKSLYNKDLKNGQTKSSKQSKRIRKSSK